MTRIRTLTSIATLAAFGAACETTVPTTDTVAPRIFAYAGEPELELMATTDSGSFGDLKTGCPAGTSATVSAVQSYVDRTYGSSITYTSEIVNSAYYYRAAAPYNFLLIARDRGGIFNMRAVAHADRDRLTDMFVFDSESRESNKDAYSLGDSATYGFTSSLHDHANISIFIYDKRPGGIGGSASMPGDEAIDGLILQIQPSGLGVAPHFYVEARDILGNGTQMVVHVLPESLCR